MKAISTPLAAAAFAIAAALAPPAQAAPQATILSETFDAINNLPGWVFLNNSAPPGLSWFQGNPGIFAAHQGAPDAYVAANYLSAENGIGTVDNWLITPTLSLSGTSFLSFYTRNDPLPGFADLLEVRFSGNGNSTAPGDFSVVLGTFGSADPYPATWQQFVATIDFTGQGRFAFRYLGAADALNYIGLDTVSVITTVPEPGAWLLLLGSLGVLAVQRRRQRV